MDLREWIAKDHAFVLARFHSAISRQVPTEMWKHTDGDASSSIAWLLFHTTCHQDLALNTAIRNHPPLLAQHRQALGLAGFAPADGLTESEDRRVTEALELDALQDYVRAVNGATAAWIDKLSTMALDSVPASSYRLEHHAGIPPDGEMAWLHAMWSGKPVSWLVQWQCIGHGHAHVGEMVGIRNRLGLSPF